MSDEIGTLRTALSEARAALEEHIAQHVDAKLRIAQRQAEMASEIVKEERAGRLKAEAALEEWKNAAIGGFGEGTTPANLLEGAQSMEQALHDSETELEAALLAWQDPVCVHCQTKPGKEAKDTHWRECPTHPAHVAIAAAVSAARQEAMEECAKIADDASAFGEGVDTQREIAAFIRARAGQDKPEGAAAPPAPKAPPCSDAAPAPPEKSPSAPEGTRAHELKCWPEFFEKLLSGEKTFEVRKDDRGFRAGDALRLREWHELEGGNGYTGREMRRAVSYLMAGPAFGIERGYCVMALAPAAPSGSTPAAGEVLAEAMEWANGHGIIPVPSWVARARLCIDGKPARSSPDGSASK